MSLGIGIGTRRHRGNSLASYWTQLISAVVENANTNKVVLTFSSPKPSLGASDFTIEGFAISGSSWTGSVLTLELSTSVNYGDYLSVVFNKAAQSNRVITNNVSPESEITTYITGLTTPLSLGQKAQLNTFIKKVKTGLSITNLSDAFDTMYFRGSETSESALKNLVKNAHHSTLEGAAVPVFEQYKGFTGSGNGYINHHYNPFVDHDNFTQDEAAFGCYILNHVDGFQFDMGCADGTTDIRFISTVGGNVALRINDAEGFEAANADSRGFYVVMRDTVSAPNLNRYVYKDGVQIGIGTWAANGLTNRDLYELAWNNNGTAGQHSTRQIGFSFTGRNLTAAEILVLTNALQDYFNSRMAFNIPASAKIVPMATLDNWSMKEAGGTPSAEMTLVNVTDLREQRKFRSTKKLRLVTGGFEGIFNQARYQFQEVDAVPKDLTNYHLLAWLNVEEGLGDTLWSELTYFQLALHTTTNTYFTYRLGIKNIEYAASGWYAFSCPVLGYTGAAGTPDMTNINYVSVQITKTTLKSPVINVGMIALVPKPSRMAELCIIADGWSASHKVIADLLTAQGMNATFPYNGAEGGLTVGELQAMEAAGHQVSSYCSNWGANPTDTAGTVAILTSMKATLSALGFTAGTRHYVHGVSSAVTQAQNDLIFPQKADNVSYAQRTLTSPYHTTYISRYHELEAALLSAIIADINIAVTSNSRMGLLIHQLDAARMTAFNTLLTGTLIPLVKSGRLRLITAKEAYQSSLTLK